MADIENSIEFSKKTQELIKKKLNDSLFNHSNWGDEDLSSVRKEIRDYYKKIQRGYCSYCKQNVSLISTLNAHIEHIVPKSLHMEYIFTPKNLCVICADCNQIKRDQETFSSIPNPLKANSSKSKRKFYPRSSSAFKVVHPHFDNYDDHILIIKGCYVDKTIKGHFTIGACRLNRKLHVFGREEDTFNDDQLSELMSDYLDETDIFLQKEKLLKLRKKMDEKYK